MRNLPNKTQGKTCEAPDCHPQNETEGGCGMGDRELTHPGRKWGSGMRKFSPLYPRQTTRTAFASVSLEKSKEVQGFKKESGS